ncbi:hypothetical protein [Aeromicrobium sp. Root495]|uniref:hypothetical protein n=1 Tax=Aeromicrobium sp. Root495 TaxID=1736550 RepID=UPI0012E98417|nr:hypothetical protein [Aeromicrobium sp. Root495]
MALLAEAHRSARAALARLEAAKARQEYEQRHPVKAFLRFLFGGPLQYGGAAGQDALVRLDPAPARTGHAWPCSLFYVGNWQDGKPLARCAHHDGCPTPTIPVLPSEPGAVIRATVNGYGESLVLTLEDPGTQYPWLFTFAAGVDWCTDADITAWEPLLTRSEWAEAVGVDELMDRSSETGDPDDLYRLIAAFLGRVDGAS